MIRKSYPKPFANKTAAGGKMLETITAMAVHHLDAMGFYRIPEDEGPTLYLAVLKPLSA